MKFKQGTIVCYKTSNGQTISGVITDAHSIIVKGAPIEIFEVLFQDTMNSRGTYLSREDSDPGANGHGNFITGATAAPATVEPIN
jgi:hypothetical protein